MMEPLTYRKCPLELEPSQEVSHGLEKFSCGVGRQSSGYEVRLLDDPESGSNPPSAIYQVSDLSQIAEPI
jgi:hypothetical protein